MDGADTLAAPAARTSGPALLRPLREARAA